MHNKSRARIAGGTLARRSANSFAGSSFALQPAHQIGVPKPERPTGSKRSSLLLGPRLRYHVRPFFVFAADEPAEFLRRSRHWLCSDGPDLVTHGRILKRGDDGPVEPADDIARRAGGSHEAEPSDRLVARQPGFIEGRDIGQCSKTAAARNRERLDVL